MEAPPPPPPHLVYSQPRGYIHCFGRHCSYLLLSIFLPFNSVLVWNRGKEGFVFTQHTQQKNYLNKGSNKQLMNFRADSTNRHMVLLKIQGKKVKTTENP